MHNLSGLGLVGLLCSKYQMDQKIKAITAIKLLFPGLSGTRDRCVGSAVKLCLLAIRPDYVRRELTDRRVPSPLKALWYKTHSHQSGNLSCMSKISGTHSVMSALPQKNDNNNNKNNHTATLLPTSDKSQSTRE